MAAKLPISAPFLKVDRLQAELKIISLLETTIGLHSLATRTSGRARHRLSRWHDEYSRTACEVFVRSRPDRATHLTFGIAHRGAKRRASVAEPQSSFRFRPLAILLCCCTTPCCANVTRRESPLAASTTRWQQYPEFAWGADASLVLARGHADINSLTVKVGKIRVSFRGTIAEFSRPADQRRLSRRGRSRRTRLAGPPERTPQGHSAIRRARVLGALRDFSTARHLAGERSRLGKWKAANAQWARRRRLRHHPGTLARFIPESKLAGRRSAGRRGCNQLAKFSGAFTNASPSPLNWTSSTRELAARLGPSAIGRLPAHSRHDCC